MAVDRQQLFGTDIFLRDGAGGLDFALGGPVGSSGDLTLAYGNDNAVQALTLRLRVNKGELAPLGWPDYGSRLHELIGEPDLARTQLKAQVFAREAALAPSLVEGMAQQVVFGDAGVELLKKVRVHRGTYPSFLKS